MKRIRFTVIAILSVFVLLLVSVPDRARANDTVVQVAIIGGAVTGGLVLIAVIGTTLTRNDPRFLLPPENATPADTGGIRFGASCPQTPGGSLSVCW